MLEPFVQHLIANRIPEYTVVILLFLPIVTTLVTVARYIIGWKSLTIYASVLLTFALYDLSRDPVGTVDIAQGIIYGGFIVAVTTFMALLLQSLTKDIRMHFVSKISLIISLITITILSIFYALVELDNVSVAEYDPIAIITIVVLADMFVRSYLRKGWRKTVYYIAGTILLSYALFLLIAQDSFKGLVLRHPEIVIYVIIFDILIGRWRGLRLSEYVRFNKLLTEEPYDSEDSKE